MLLAICLAALVGAGGLLCTPGFVGALRDKLMDPDSTIHVRAFLWPAAWHMFLARPMLGWGPGSFLSTVYTFLSPESGKYQYVGIGAPKSGLLTHAHNEILERMAETGVLGTLAVAVLLGLILVRVFRRLDSLPPDVRVCHAGLAAGLVAVFVHSCGGVAVRFWELAPLFWMGLGLLENSSSYETTGDTRRVRPSSLRLGMLAVSAVIALPVFWHAVVLDYRSQVDLRRGALAEQRGQFDRGARLYESAISSTTYNVDLLRAHFKRAICLGKAGRLAEARDAFHRLERFAPGLDVSRLLLARVEVALGNPEAARAALAQYERQNPFGARAQLVLMALDAQKSPRATNPPPDK